MKLRERRLKTSLPATIRFKQFLGSPIALERPVSSTDLWLFQNELEVFT
jgi:hypothetical protein